MASKIKPILYTVVIIFAVLINGWVVLSSESYEGSRIVDIKFKGLYQADVLSVKSAISTREKDELSLEKLDGDIKSLYKLGLFQDIKVDVEPVEGGVILTFIFTEYPTIRELIIKGNKKVAERTIRDEILIKKGDIYRESKLQADIKKIIELYKSKGLPHTEVSYTIKEDEEVDKKTGEKKKVVDITIKIKEGKRVIVKSINFVGVTIVKEEKLKFKMKTRERGYWLSSGYFRESDLESDKITILNFYGERGYIDARIVKIDKKSTLNEKKNREELEITIYIEEGKQYTFGGVNIEGNRVFTDEELYSLIKLKEGEVFNKLAWESSVQAIRSLMADNGYIYYTMKIDENKDVDNLTVSYNIFIRENQRAHIEHIFITGNEKTKDFVIRRELEVHEGEIFNAAKIQRSIEKLYNLQYFSSVNIDVKPGSELGLVDLIFNVEEQRTGMFSFGLSYSTAGYGVSLYEEVSANNFLGRGIKLHEKVEVGLIRQVVEVGIDEPWLMNTPTSAGFSISWSRIEYGPKSGDVIYTYNNETIGPEGQELPDGVTWTQNEDGTYSYDYSEANSMEYINQNYTASFRIGRRFYRFYGVNSELSFSVYRNYSDSDDVPFDPSLRDQYENNWPWNWKNYLGLTFYRDTRDYTLFATRGSYISQNVTFYGGPLGGYSDFVRLSTDLNYNVKTFWKFVLSTRLNFGFILPWLGKPLTIDDSDYLRVDCMNEGRGWQNPSQFLTLYTLRGKSELNFSLEYRFPIQERVLWGVTFFDASNLFPTPEDFSIDLKDFYYSFGLGASFVIPGFPIRLYLARRFKYNYLTDRWELANSQKFFRRWDFVFAVAGLF